MMAFWDFFTVASMPVVKILLISCLGVVLSTKYVGVLTEQSRRSLNKIRGKKCGVVTLEEKDTIFLGNIDKNWTKDDIRGKKCRVVTLEEKDTIFLGNIDKNWTKDDLLNKLKEIGVENIDNVYVIEDPNNIGVNRGFSFLELESHKDAQLTFRAFAKKNIFGKDRNVKVDWPKPLNDPDEDLMVKSVFVHGLLTTWNEEQVKVHFNNFGEIERVVLASNMESSKRKEFGFVNYTTREVAIACIEAFIKDDELVDRDSKVKVKVSLAKPANKGKVGKRKWKGTP